MAISSPSNSGDEIVVNGGNAQAKTKSDNSQTSPTFPPPKTDKPRPHVCGECKRSFARLEHLKRHERSHTKEKPFQCPECQRCFARRDLLLRHQQKLHQAGAASTRPRGGRRESTSGTQPSGTGRVRKNSVASSISGVPGSTSTMRPRANTISHIDGPTLDHLFGAGIASNRFHPSVGGVPGNPGFDYRGMSTAYGHHGSVHSLPKLETHGLNIIGGGLRTAPIQGMGESFELDKLLAAGSTINPNQLHFSGSIGSPTSPFFNIANFHGQPGIEDDEHFDWNAPLDGSMVLNGDHAVDGSSPSAISTASQSGFSEVMLDGSNNPAATSGAMWQNSMMASSMVPDIYPMVDTVGAAVFPELVSPMNTVSPQELHDQNNVHDNLLFSSPPPLTAISPTSAIPGMPNQYFQPPITFNSDSTSISSASVNGSSARQSSVTSVSTDSITDATRQALLYSLSQPTGFGHTQRKFSQPISSPISPGFAPRSSVQAPKLPSTSDLQRYVSAYIHYFHPHLPFLHISTLSFDSPAFTSNLQSHNSFMQEGIIGGGGCLILAMAAIGALYEFEHEAARELFESAKKIISLYLEERRKAGLTAASNVTGALGGRPIQKTPLWLVQAMLLNLIYGHNCGDKLAAEIATTHCAALVSLAKAAELDKVDPDPGLDDSQIFGNRSVSLDGDVEMVEDGFSTQTWNRGTPQDARDLQAEWYRWKIQEERKRTLYSVFTLSSLLVIGYNQAPRILNSEIHLKLPCEEDLWAADSPQAWAALGGSAAAEKDAIPFADALSYLLMASQRQQTELRPTTYHPIFGSSVPLGEVPESDLKPSTFGCYVLINALHVYIWETRQRHNGRQWKTQETEQMHAQIEPALKAWQAAWKSNPHHSLERPNPYGPLPADSIPLLDLAYVRLFVNLGRSKLAFWERDFEAMSEELGRGVEIIQHAEDSRDGSSEPTDSTVTTNTSSSSPGMVGSPQDPSMRDVSNEIPNAGGNPTPPLQPGQCTKRERHLRKAAFYAADSLNMADKLGVTFAEFTSRELPIQSAMCTFDCVQVLAEWVATIQERVGPYLKVLGRDEIDFTQVPAILLLEDEDLKLIEKINDILNHAEMKMAFDTSIMGNTPTPFGPLSNLRYGGYGSKLLLVMAHMLDKGAVWPITCVMARALETHAMYINQRAENSVPAT